MPNNCFPYFLAFILLLFSLHSCQLLDDTSIKESDPALTNAILVCVESEKIAIDTLDFYSGQALALANKYGSDLEKKYANFYRGLYFSYINVLDSSNYYNELILATSTITPDTLYIQNRALLQKGTNLYKQAKYKDALAWYFSIYPSFENGSDTKSFLRLLNNIGLCNIELQRYEESIRWFKKMLSYDLKNKPVFEATAVYNIADAYANLKQFDSSLVYCNNAITLSTINHLILLKANTLNTLAKIYTAQGNLLQAKDLVEQSLAIHRNNKFTYYVISDLNQLVLINIKLNDYAKAEAISLEALALTEENELESQMYYTYNILVEIYLQQKNYKKAAFYSQKALNALLKTNEAASAKSIAEMEVKYETAKKEQKIQEQSFQLQKKNNIIIGTLLLSLILILIALLIFRSYRYKQKQQLQHAIIHEQAETTKAIIKAEEQERSRVSQLLHDGVGQLLSGLKMNLQVLEERIDLGEHRTIYTNSMRLLNDAVSEIRDVSHDMQPNYILQLGLGNALLSLTEKLDNRRLHFEQHIDPAINNISGEIQLMVYRIMQECINNTLKHAQASQVHINLDIVNKQLIAVYKDNGKGFDLSNIPENKSIGLSNMRSRIRYLKGKHKLQSVINQGTIFSFEIPVNQ